MARDILYKTLLPDDASFQLVRTNPKLTGNVKVTVNENDEIFLNSIDANEELAKSIYKRFPLDTRLTHETNIKRFFDGGKTPPQIVFDLNEDVDLTKTSSKYSEQYDFSNYFSGVKYLVSNQFEEKFSYFAPLYLQKEIPDYFIIFKLEDPVNYESLQSEANYPFDKSKYLFDAFKNGTIIKTYDISKNTKVGKYIRDYVNGPQFPSSPLTVKYEDDLFTTWNGIGVSSGAQVEKGELLSDFFKQAWPLKYFEEYFTLGYERNNVIFPNIWNMEFVFTDETSDIYDFNRYIGFYVNKVELGKMKIDLDRLYLERGSAENTPRFRRKYSPDEEIVLNQENEDGVIVPFKESEVKVSEFADYLNQDDLYFNYIDQVDGDMILPKPTDAYETEIEDGEELDTLKVRFSNKKMDIGELFGPSNIFIQDEAFVPTINGEPHGYVKLLTSLNHLDSIKLYHPHGTQSDTKGKYDEFIGVETHPDLPNPGDFYFYNDIDNIVGHDRFYFNITGTKEDVMGALRNCIANVREKGFRAYNVDEYVFVKGRARGNFDDLYGLEFVSLSGDYSTVEIDETTGSALIDTRFNFKGGAKLADNRLVIDREHRTKLENRINDLLIKTEKGWSSIAKISNYVDLINDDLDTDLQETEAINSFFDKIVVVLEKEERPNIEFGECIIKEKFYPGFGLISFFPIRDLDFDFFSSTFTNFPVNDLYKYFFIPEGVQLLELGKAYKVRGIGTIDVSGISYSGGDTFTVASDSSFSVLTGNPVVTLDDSTSSPGDRLDVPIADENEELQAFPGFFTIKDPDRVIPQSDSDSFQFRDKYLNGITDTEYDYLKENFSTDFALKSKIIPYICKWGKTLGRDIRDNPYRLNNSLIFGFNNFAPSQTDRSQLPGNFTHEWFYIESLFNYVNTQETIKNNNSYFDEPLDIDRLLTDEDYFLEYFTYTPRFNGEEVGKTQHRYSSALFNDLEQSEIFFKGIQFVLRDVLNPNVNGANSKPIFNENSRRFNGYRFSITLKPIKEDINDKTQQPIKYRVIEHKDFKFITIVIELVIGSKDSINEYWFEVPTLPSDPDTVDRTNFLNSPASVGEQLYDSINGDYRIEFTDIDGLEISDLTYTLLYSLKNKKYNTTGDNFSTIKLTSILDLSNTGAFVGGTNQIPKLDNLTLPNYPSFLSDELNSFTDSTFIIDRNIPVTQDFFLDLQSGFIPQNISLVNGAESEYITVSETTNLALINTSNIITSTIPSGIPASVFQNTHMFKQLSGGRNYYESLLQKLSFAEFKDYVNNLNPIVEYETYALDSNGNTVIVDDPFYMEISDDKQVQQTEAITAVVDQTKPSQFSFTDVIGFSYEKTPLNTAYEINRYDGGYSPITRDVLCFKSRFTFDKNDFEDITIGNISFNTNLTNFAELPNFNHIKIAPTKVLTLESDQAFDPVYPLINESAIGQEDFFLFLSNWEYGFHWKYLDKSEKTPVPGSLRIEEDSSFVGKVLTLQDEIELEDFQITELDEADELEDVDTNEIEFVFKENTNSVEGIININNVLTRYFLDTGISAKFDQYLEESEEFIGNFNSIEEYVDAYIRTNLLQLFETAETVFSTKINKTIVSENQVTDNRNTVTFVNGLDDAERFEQGFAENKNTQINKVDKLLLRFSLNKDVKGTTEISPKVKIRLI